MCIMILRVRMNWTSYISFLLLMIVFGFLPLILYFFGLVDVLWPAVSTASFGLAAFIAMLLIANQSFMTQLTRRFHL